MTEQTFLLRVRSNDMTASDVLAMVLALCADLVEDQAQTEILSLEVAQDYAEFRPLL